MKSTYLVLCLLVTACLWYPSLAKKGKKGKKDEACHKDDAGSEECSSHSSTTSRYQPLLSGMKHGEKLTVFIDRVIRPTKEFNKRSNEIIDKLVRSLQHMSGPFKSRIKRVVKCGSLGKGTHVKDRSDIDLIVFFNGYSSVQELQADQKNLLKKLKDFVQKDWSEYLRHKGTTPSSVQFFLKIKENDNEHEVDLLPAVDITQSGRPLSDVYKEMKGLTPQDRGVYSSCLGPLQLEFVTKTDRVSTPGVVKDLIRLLKYWAKAEDVPVRSYFLELLVVRQWREAGKPQKIIMEESLRQILEQLVDLKNMNIAFDDNYNYKEFVPQQKKPYLLDPANPFRNVAPSSRDINTVVEKAKELLERFE